MGKLSDEILSDLAKRKGGGGYSKADDGDPEDQVDGGDDEAEEGAEPQTDEEQAVEEFRNAKSPAAAAEALRSFIEICYPQLAK